MREPITVAVQQMVHSRMLDEPPHRVGALWSQMTHHLLDECLKVGAVFHSDKIVKNQTLLGMNMRPVDGPRAIGAYLQLTLSIDTHR